MGVTPNVPELSDIYESDILTSSRDGSYNVTVTTDGPHGFEIGETVRVQQTISPLSTTGIRVDISIFDSLSDIAAKAALRINAETDFTT